MVAEHRQQESFTLLANKNKHWAQVVEFAKEIDFDVQATGEKRIILDRFKDFNDMASLKTQQEQLVMSKRKEYDLKIQQLKMKRDRLLEEHQRRQKLYKEQLAVKKKCALINYINDQYNQITSLLKTKMSDLPKIFSSHPDDLYASQCLEVKRLVANGDDHDGDLINSLIDNIGIDGVMKIAIDLLLTIQRNPCRIDLPVAGRQMVAEFQTNFGRSPVTHQQAILAKLKGQKINFEKAALVVGETDVAKYKALMASTCAMMNKCIVDFSIDFGLMCEYKECIDCFNRASNQFTNHSRLLLQQANEFDFSNSTPIPMAPLKVQRLDRAYLRMKAFEQYYQSLPCIEMENDQDDEMSMAKLSDSLLSLKRQASVAKEYIAKLKKIKQFPLYKLDKINTII